MAQQGGPPRKKLLAFTKPGGHSALEGRSVTQQRSHLLRESSVDSTSFTDSNTSGDGGSALNDEKEEENEDVDAVRAVQWAGEEELEEDSGDESSSSFHVPSTGPSDTSRLKKIQIDSLEDDLAGLPFGTLRKARLSLDQAHALDDSDNEDAGSQASDPTTDDEDVAPRFTSALITKRMPERTSERRAELSKRPNKHAPTEITSKRPVTRRRMVVDVQEPKPRDPRFIASTEYSPEKFQKAYDFLADTRSEELSTLLDNLKRARKLLRTSPRDLYDERAQEVTRLELAVKRAESAVNRDKRERIERGALDRLAEEERQKRKQGKGSWWMKTGDKNDLLLRARHDALAASGGNLAVKKAIEKKQRKTYQKEKRSRPFQVSRDSGWNTGRHKRRNASGDEAARPFKKARF